MESKSDILILSLLFNFCKSKIYYNGKIFLIAVAHLLYK